MSWATCYSGSNNIHNKFPPIMADGRNYTNWQHGSTIDENIRKSNGIRSNYEYRNYLVNNSDKVINQNRNSAYNNCTSYVTHYTRNGPDSPYMYTSSFDNSQPYGYVNSDLKNVYLSKKQLQERQITPFVTEQTLSQFANK